MTAAKNSGTDTESVATRTPERAATDFSLHASIAFDIE